MTAMSGTGFNNEMRRNLIHSPRSLADFKWLLVTLALLMAIMGPSDAFVKKIEARENRQLLFSVLGLPVQSVGWIEAASAKKFSAASFRARPNLCRGKRLDSTGSFHPDNFISASQCASFGGNCCNLSPEWGYASNDPRFMKPFDGCHGCYDTNVTVQCSGKVLRTRYGNEEEDDSSLLHQVTAKNCLQSGGQCCDPRSIPELFGSVGVFDPRQYPGEELCSNCFSGSMSGLECSGKLLLSETYTGDTCSQFDGKCCEGIYGAFDPIHYPGRDCSSCFSGSVQPNQ